MEVIGTRVPDESNRPSVTAELSESSSGLDVEDLHKAGLVRGGDKEAIGAERGARNDVFE